MNPLTLSDPHALAGKISLNIEMHGEDDEVIGFTLPLTLMLGQEALDGLMGKYFHRSLYNQVKDLWEIVDGFKRCHPLALEDTYEGVHAKLGLSSYTPLEFTDCRVSKIVLEPQHGGMTQVKLNLYLIPGTGDENLALQEHIHREISVELAEGKIALKKNPKQGKLPLDAPDPGAAQSEIPPAENVQTSAQTSELVPGEPPVGFPNVELPPPGDGEATLGVGMKVPDETGIVSPPPFVGRSGAEIDAEMRARHPDADQSVVYADTPEGEALRLQDEAAAAGVEQLVPNTQEELDAFERNAKAARDAFTTRPEGVLDGRSERVKYQDAQREAAES